ncbi:hypothetical protein BS78_07G067900 [Paspalum vaginatum]|nr:hypothetical protein BS78_07G067900 [Paspalum vaginatum]
MVGAGEAQHCFAMTALAGSPSSRLEAVSSSYVASQSPGFAGVSLKCAKVAFSSRRAAAAITSGDFYTVLLWISLRWAPLQCCCTVWEWVPRRHDQGTSPVLRSWSTRVPSRVFLHAKYHDPARHVLNGVVVTPFSAASCGCRHAAIVPFKK